MRKNNDNYLGRIDPENNAWESSPWTELIKERYNIASLLSKDKLILDSCCGTGWGTINYIVPIAKFTIGFDIYKATAVKDKESSKYHFVKMDAKNITLQENSFDIVLALDSIEHFTLEDGKKYLAEMKKVCKETGIILGTTPLVIDLSLIPTYLRWNKYHLHMYTPETLDNILKQFFTAVKIYWIYNLVCPYLLFICKKTGNIIPKDITDKIDGFISERTAEYKKGKFHAYLSWSKHFIARGELLKALLSFCRAGRIMMENFFS